MGLIIYFLMDLIGRVNYLLLILFFNLILSYRRGSFRNRHRKSIDTV